MQVRVRREAPGLSWHSLIHVEASGPPKFRARRRTARSRESKAKKLVIHSNGGNHHLYSYNIKM